MIYIPDHHFWNISNHHTDDPINHPNALDDAKIELKPHVPHIKFVDVNDVDKFSVVIFVGLAAKEKERLLK